ncbi:MAG: class I SAM-dependent RNA methyltransferase [Anaerolineae bacterium]
MNTTFEITLERLTYGGEAMGRLPDGRAVFVPFALPGERVRLRLLEEKRGFARAELLDVLSASPERISPRCRHFGSCGGCHYQQLPYAAQLRAKTDILREQLQRIGRIEQPPVAPMVASPQEWNYRNHVQFHLTAEGKIGFVNARSDEILPIAECHLPEAPINALWPELQFDSNPDLERVALRCGTNGDLMLILESDSPQPPEIAIETDISVVHLFADHSVVLAGTDHLFMRVLGRDFRLSAGAFFQVNTPMAEKMVAHLLANLPLSPTDTLLDLYCGAGLFSAFFAGRAGRVIGVESSAAACEDFVFNLDEFENVELYEGLAEEILPALVEKIGTVPYVLLDPPRAGLGRRVLDALLALAPHTIAYVSCDPATLARDARRLVEDGYSLQQVTPFDLFPQTFHIESISIFRR